MSRKNKVKNYEFTAFCEDDFGIGNINVGSCFTMPASATTCINVKDNDAFLSGDSKCNENSNDRSYQNASIDKDGSEVGNKGQIYAESYYIVKDQDGNRYVMIEIEQEGSNDDYFTFFNGYGYTTPPAGSDLSVVQCCNVTSNWIDFKCLGAGPKEAPTGSISGQVFCDLDCDGIQDEANSKPEYTYGPNLIVNGDFEDNGLNNCGWGSGNLAGWYDIGSVKAQIHEQNYGHGNAKGDAIVELECGVVLCQQVKVTDAGCYLLSFDVTRRGNKDQDNTFTLYIDGAKHEQYTVTEAGTIEIELDLSEGDHRFDFKSNSYSYKGAGLDDVSLQLKTPVENTPDPGKEGVTVNLVDADGNIVDTTTTDADGNYKFEKVVDGDYTVQVVAPAGQEFTLQDVGSNDAIDSDVNSAGVSGVISLSGGNDVTDVDAGLKEAKPVPGSLSGTYFCDDNRDGVDNAGDADVANKMVTLLNADGTPATDIDGNPVAATMTDSNGNYSFDNLAAGDYKVMFEDSAAEGKAFISQTTGTADGSDVDPANGMTNVVTVNAGEETTDVDAGVEAIPGSLSGTYFCDDNRDGVDNAGDADVANKTVTLLNADGTAATDIDGNPVASVETDSEGNYRFDNLAAGDYKVMFEDSAAEGKAFIAQTTGTADGSDVDPTNGMTNVVTVNAGEETTDVDAGVEAIAGSLSGTYFCDENRDGADDGAADGDKDVAGKTVTLLNADGTPATDINGNVIAPVQTGENGNYRFDNLAAGDYKVMFEDSSAEGKQFIAQNAGNDDTDDSDVDPANGMTGTVSVVAGEETTDVDAGVEAIPGSLSGTYFCDDNNNGVDDGADADVANKTVTLLNADGTPATDIDGNPVAPVMTDAQGNYRFDNLATGDYKVMFEDSDDEGKQFIAQTTGTADGSDVDPANGMTNVVSVTAGNETTDVDAGVEEIPNEAPTPMDDAEDTCYFDAVSIDVTANDTDPENDALTVTAINGMAIAEGEPAIDIDGVQVTLVGGELVFDGSVAHADLLTGEEAITNYTYTVSDGNGNDASANVEVTFCGATDTLDKVKDIIPTSVQFQLIDENDPAPSSDEAWTMKVTDATGVLSGTFAFAYCLSAFDNSISGQFGSDINAAALIDANVYVAADDCLPGTVDFGGTGLNGLDASENLDMINWIINQDFTSQDNGDGTASNYTDNEIQAAIWGLTDGIIFVSDDGHSTTDNATEIYNAAIANGEGFEANAANGDLTTVYFDPTGDNDPDKDHVQPFIAAIDLFDDCIC